MRTLDLTRECRRQGAERERERRKRTVAVIFPGHVSAGGGWESRFPWSWDRGYPWYAYLSDPVRYLSLSTPPRVALLRNSILSSCANPTISWPVGILCSRVHRPTNGIWLPLVETLSSLVNLVGCLCEPIPTFPPTSLHSISPNPTNFHLPMIE